eukprot:6466482-Amphidinium_carterae.1
MGGLQELCKRSLPIRQRTCTSVQICLVTSDAHLMTPAHAHKCGLAGTCRIENYLVTVLT